MSQSTYYISGMHCGSCALNIEDSMKKLEEVEHAHVDFGKKVLTLTFNNVPLSLEELQQHMVDIGEYTLSANPPEPRSLSLSTQMVLWGIAGALGITLLFYLVQALGMQSLSAPINFSLNKWYFVLPLIIGFGVQLSLFRAIHLKVKHGGGRIVAASGGVSTTSMIACCMHNFVTLFPILGLSGLAVFFAAYQNYVFGVSLLFVLFGVAYMTIKYKKISYILKNT